MQDVDGIQLRTAFWPAKLANDNLPLLFFNGIGANLELTQGLGDMFPDRDIITFDVPGVGKSPVTQWPSAISLCKIAAPMKPVPPRIRMFMAKPSGSALGDTEPWHQGAAILRWLVQRANLAP